MRVYAASRAALGGALAMAALVGCQPRNEFVAPPPPQVTVAQPLRTDLAETVEFTGATAASSRVDVRSRVRGSLQKVAFEDGGWVEKGQLLFLIEPRPFQVALDAAQAELAKAQASLQLETADHARIMPLAQNRTVTQAELDVADAELATARATVDAAQAAVERAELDLSYTEIHAAISGRIGRHMVDLGNLVLPETTLLATIENTQPLYVYFNVTESEVLRFMEMTRSDPQSAGQDILPTLRLSLGSDAPFAYEGKVDYMDPHVDPATGTALRRGVFPNEDRSLIPGLFVRVQSTLGKPAPRLMIPEQAVGADQRGEFVLVVNDQGVVEQRPVRLGMRNEGLRVVDKGLGPNDWVVVNGMQRARPGAPVNPQKSTLAEQVASQANKAGGPVSRTAASH